MSQPNLSQITHVVQTGALKTAYQRMGQGPSVLLLHGSGAGVSAWSNWRLIMPELAPGFDVVAPDLAGFGSTTAPEGTEYRFLDTWVDQIIGLLDALGIKKTHVVGNSFGGALALALTARHPERFDRVVLMGTAGVAGEITRELDELWGYQPSRETMRKVLGYMIYDQASVTDDLVEMRYQSTMQPGVSERFAALFPAPRQQHWDAMVTPLDQLRSLDNSFLLVHGRDDRVCPTWTSLTLLSALKDAQLHVLSRCGHWAMIEQRDRFVRLVNDFLTNG